MSTFFFYCGLVVIFLMCMIAGMTLAVALYLVIKGGVHELD